MSWCSRSTSVAAWSCRRTCSRVPYPWTYVASLGMRFAPHSGQRLWRLYMGPRRASSSAGSAWGPSGSERRLRNADRLQPVNVVSGTDAGFKLAGAIHPT